MAPDNNVYGLRVTGQPPENVEVLLDGALVLGDSKATDQTIRLAQEAAKRGWLDFKGAGNVFEINFRQLLTTREIQASHGPN